MVASMPQGKRGRLSAAGTSKAASSFLIFACLAALITLLSSSVQAPVPADVQPKDSAKSFNLSSDSSAAITAFNFASGSVDLLEYENLKVKLSTCEYNLNDLVRQTSKGIDLQFDKTTAADSQYKGEIKICGTKFWDKTGCDPDYYLICTSSMAYTFSCYNAVVVYKTDSIKVGDVIAFNVPKEAAKTDYGQDVYSVFKIHRVVGINGTRFVTAGDTTYFVDTFQPSTSDIIGKVKTVVY